MRILIDENLPIGHFTEILSEFDTQTIKNLGWEGIQNGELMKRIEGEYDLFITADKNIQYQQKLSERSFAIIEVFTNRLPLLKAWEVAIIESVRTVRGNEYKKIGPQIGD